MGAKAAQGPKQVEEDRRDKWVTPVIHRGLGGPSMTAEATTPLNLTKKCGKGETVHTDCKRDQGAQTTLARLTQGQKKRKCIKVGGKWNKAYTGD